MDIKFSGAITAQFKNVDVYCDYHTGEYFGNVQIIDGKLFMKDVYIPIRRDLVRSACYKLSRHKNSKYTYFEFHILPDGDYMYRWRSYANAGDNFLGRIMDCTATWEWNDSSTRI